MNAKLYVCPCTYTVGDAPKQCPECRLSSRPYPADDEDAGRGDAVSAPNSILATVETRSAKELIQLSKNKPPVPVIDGLLAEGEILLIHGEEESFKSVFAVQLAESIASGRLLLRTWNVPEVGRVGIVETEIHEQRLGDRLKRMFPGEDPPDGLVFLSDKATKALKRGKTLEEKLEFLRRWIREQDLDVLVLDTANDFFRGKDNPNDETDAGEFFDRLRDLGITSLVVRHDHKPKGTPTLPDSPENPNNKIRGSAEWKEDPETILYLDRKDRRTHEVRFEVSKLRYGMKPDPMTLWFDKKSFRLVPLPPPIAVLEDGPKSRQELVEECKERFGIGHTRTDEMLEGLKPFLNERQDSHSKVFELNRSGAAGAEWGRFLNPCSTGSAAPAQENIPQDYAVGPNSPSKSSYMESFSVENQEDAKV